MVLCKRLLQRPALQRLVSNQGKARTPLACGCGNVAAPRAQYLTEHLKRALEDSVLDPDRLHQRLFFALCRDLTNLAALENSVEADMILDLVSDYATGEWEAQEPDPFLK
jgi:hypothetical protein